MALVVANALAWCMLCFHQSGTAALDIQSGPAYQTHNVIGEIRGTTRPDDVYYVGKSVWIAETFAFARSASSSSGNV